MNNKQNDIITKEYSTKKTYSDNIMKQLTDEEINELISPASKDISVDMSMSKDFFSKSLLCKFTTFIRRYIMNRIPADEELLLKADTVFGEGTCVKGDITNRLITVINGKVFGDVTCKMLLVGKKGYVNGSISANKVIIQGKVDGDINAYETLAIRSTGGITGDIASKYLEVNSGACIEGICKITHN